MKAKRIAALVAKSYLRGVYGKRKIAGPLTNPKHLRYQAVFLMGPAGSGKSYVVNGKYLNYMPGASASGVRDPAKLEEMLKREVSEQERSLSNLAFEGSVTKLKGMGYEIALTDATKSRIPFRLYEYPEEGPQILIPRDQWKDRLEPSVYKEVQKMEDVIFGAPVHELPSYWRQVNPDIYKEELPGFRSEKPGYVHEMSSEMSKAYFWATLESGDPVVVDGTGSKLGKMLRQIGAAKDAGYRVSLLYVYVPLTVSLLRNATRTRRVKPSEVLDQWRNV